MDIIDSYNKLTLGKYMEIQEVSRNESLEDIDKQVQILSILTGVAEEEILHLPIQDYKELVAKSAFLDPENINYHPVAKKYLLGKFELIPCRDFRKIERVTVTMRDMTSLRCRKLSGRRCQSLMVYPLQVFF